MLMRIRMSMSPLGRIIGHAHEYVSMAPDSRGRFYGLERGLDIIPPCHACLHLSHFWPGVCGWGD